ncbi:unnamed protein product [Didymodactylos carnosus]|uniref:BD-FAE-like domain-containing protein n=1 Tax=Didymodactylos carnosus TaxID=1234261 RepID=A0A815L548_9BILA|nr:unnamed protein product [Didymodactylos carnosus]CAF1399687.1 unnamed protein product [Didymodactylos carnosus]CAF4070793.1 unnamed protein product [Didymodactylos carnosus]CAF4293627.1 unnamed protein product [Didymodactylos carnosus]
MYSLSNVTSRLRFTPVDTNVIHNIVYYNGTESEPAHVNHRLDIWIPPTPSPSPQSTESTTNIQSQKIPIVIHVHGGGWQRGNKNNEWRGGPNIGRCVAKENMIGVVISYRLAAPSIYVLLLRCLILAILISIPLSFIIKKSYLKVFSITYVLIIPIMFLIGRYFYKQPIHIDHMLEDVCRAITYVREHIEEHCQQADINSIYLSGHSAGAHLISLLVLNPEYFKKNQIKNPYSFIKVDDESMIALGNEIDSKAYEWLQKVIKSQIVQLNAFIFVGSNSTLVTNVPLIFCSCKCDLKEYYCVISMSGIYSLRNPLHDEYFNFRNIFFRLMYVSSAIPTHDILTYSPIEYIIKHEQQNDTDKNLHHVPFLVLSAQMDLGLEIDAQRFVSKLKQHHYYVEYYIIPKTSHATIASQFPKYDSHKHYFEFIKKIQTQTIIMSQ